MFLYDYGELDSSMQEGDQRLCMAKERRMQRVKIQSIPCCTGSSCTSFQSLYPGLPTSSDCGVEYNTLKSYRGATVRTQ